MPKRRHPGARGPRRRGIPSVIASTRFVDVAAARAAAAAKHERRVGAVLELDLDECKLSFGTTNEFGTCTATGEPCHQTFGTCKDKPNYVKGVHIWRFCTRGMKLPPGDRMRPYIPLKGISIAPAEIDPNKGLAVRSSTSITLVDEPDSDIEGDPYAQAVDYLSLPGTAGNYASTPDSAAVSITGDIDIRAHVSLNDWTPAAPNCIIGKYAGAGNQRSYVLQIQVGGTVRFFWSPDGANEFTASATALPPVSDGQAIWLRVTFDVDNGAGGNDAKFYTSSDGVTWTQLGATVTGAGVTSQFDNATQVEIGSLLNGTANLVAGKIYYAELRNGIDGPVVARFDVAEAKAGATSFFSGTGERWTINQSGTPSASLVGKRLTPAAGTLLPRQLARWKHVAGRPARLRRGFIVEPWSWDTWQTEHYIIESIKGPDRSGHFRVMISDTLRLLDSVQIPAPTPGKLAADLKAVSDTGTAQAGGAATITLRTQASAVDDAYNGQEVLLLENTGAGQRRVISDYVGATRVATVAAAWAVQPNATTIYEVVPLSLTLGAGQGALYPDPAGTGGKEYVQIKDEQLAYTAKAGDALSWPDGTHRGQFGTTRADAKVDDGVQLCESGVDRPPEAVIRRLLNVGGLGDEKVDLAGLAQEAADWLAIGANVTYSIGRPEKASELLRDLLSNLNLLAWPDPVADLVRFKADMPAPVTSVTALTDNELKRVATQVDHLDAEVLTRAAIWYEPRSATANLKESKNFARAEARIDKDAEGPNERNAVISETRYSRWFTIANTNFVSARVARLVGRRRDTPRRARFELDPRNELALGALVDITSRAMPDQTGAPIATRVRVTKKQDHLTHAAYEARTTNLGRRYFFIGPAGLPDYGAATEVERAYGFISDANGLMSDGTEGYVIS